MGVGRVGGVREWRQNDKYECSSLEKNRGRGEELKGYIERQSKEYLEILESPLAVRARGNRVKTKMRGWQMDRANDYRIVWIRRALGEQNEYEMDRNGA